MAIKVGDILKPQNETFPITQSEDVKGAMKSVDTVADLRNIPDNRLYPGNICYVKENETYYMYYVGTERSTGWYPMGFTEVAVQDAEPASKNILWIDTTTGRIPATQSQYDLLTTQVAALQHQYEKVSGIINSGIIAGDYTVGQHSSFTNQPPHTVTNIGIKYGKFTDFQNNPLNLVNGEIIFASNEDESEWKLYVYKSNKFYEISGNSTTIHTATPTTYSATLSKPEIDVTDALAKPTIKLNNIINENLKITQVYLGGNTEHPDAAYDYGFIELYNTSEDNELDITGLYLLYVNDKKEVQYHELNGIIKPNNTYIIRLHKSGIPSNITHKLSTYNEVWNGIIISNNYDEFSLFLSYQYAEIPNRKATNRIKKAAYIDKFIVKTNNKVLSNYNGIIDENYGKIYLKQNTNNDDSICALYPYFMDKAQINLITPGTRNISKFNTPLSLDNANWVSIMPVKNIIPDLDEPSTYVITWTIIGYYPCRVAYDNYNNVNVIKTTYEKWFYNNMLVTTYREYIQVKNNITFSIEQTPEFKTIIGYNIDIKKLSNSGLKVYIDNTHYGCSDNVFGNNMLFDFGVENPSDSTNHIIFNVYNNYDDFTIKNSLNENIISLPIFSLALYNKLSSIKRITIPEDTKYNIYTVAYGDILITVIGEVDNNDIENIQNHINDILKNNPNYKHTAISYDKDRLDLSKYDNVIFCEKDKVIEENIVK